MAVVLPAPSGPIKPQIATIIVLPVGVDCYRFARAWAS
ncbi:hypothetical protein DCWBC2_0904 [Dehalococcoides mccartyi]|nr:hypothetical protein DCWBC2_0904 [Dehalococcoides mccartyi]